MTNSKPSCRLARLCASAANVSAITPHLSDVTSPELRSGQRAYCHEPDATGYLAPPPAPPPSLSHCGLSLAPPPRPRLSYVPKRNILALANIAPVAIFRRTSTWSRADQGPPVCFLTLVCLPRSPSVLCLFLTCCFLGCSLPLRVCLALLCIMFIAYLLFPWLFLTVACLPHFTLRYVYCLACVLVVSYCLRVCLVLSVVEERRGRVGSCVSWVRRWSHDGKLCISLAGEAVIPQWRKRV